MGVYTAQVSSAVLLCTWPVDHSCIPIYRLCTPAGTCASHTRQNTLRTPGTHATCSTTVICHVATCVSITLCTCHCCAQGTPWAPAKGAVKNIRGTQAACIAWHPSKLLLAIAWQDGAVSVWDAAQRHMEEDSKMHRHPISHLQWDAAGTCLLTADTQGKVCTGVIHAAGRATEVAHALCHACTHGAHNWQHYRASVNIAATPGLYLPTAALCPVGGGMGSGPAPATAAQGVCCREGLHHHPRSNCQQACNRRQQPAERSNCLLCHQHARQRHSHNQVVK